MPTIEVIYRARINYSGEGQDAVTDRAFQLGAKEPGVEIASFDGCPACVPYIEIESPNRPAVDRLAGKIERYINRRSDVTEENDHA